MTLLTTVEKAVSKHQNDNDFVVMDSQNGPLDVLKIIAIYGGEKLDEKSGRIFTQGVNWRVSYREEGGKTVICFSRIRQKRSLEDWKNWWMENNEHMLPTDDIQ